MLQCDWPDISAPWRLVRYRRGNCIVWPSAYVTLRTYFGLTGNVFTLVFFLVGSF